MYVVWLFVSHNHHYSRHSPFSSHSLLLPSGTHPLTLWGKNHLINHFRSLPLETRLGTPFTVSLGTSIGPLLKVRFPFTYVSVTRPSWAPLNLLVVSPTIPVLRLSYPLSPISTPVSSEFGTWVLLTKLYIRLTAPFGNFPKLSSSLHWTTKNVVFYITHELFTKDFMYFQFRRLLIILV